MKKRKLGKQGLEVSALGLGCMGMSFAYHAATEGDCLKTLHRSLELGINFWDTAELYGPFKNEELLAKALRGKREQVVVATKFAFTFGPDGTRTGLDSSPAHLKKAVEGSLKRLGTDHIDLLYQHRLDPKTPIEDTVGAMAELIREGKVRHLGLSEVGPKTLERAHAVHPLTALQSEYSLWENSIEKNVLPTLRRLGIGLVPYSPVGRGFLTGQIKTFEDLPQGDFRRLTPRFQGENFQLNIKLVDEVKRIAERKKVTAAQVALAWLLRQGEDIVPIPGTTQVSHLEENAKAVDLGFSPQDWVEVDRVLSAFKVSGERYPAEAMKQISQE